MSDPTPPASEGLTREQVERFDVYDDQGREGVPLIEVDGAWVKFTDYAALRAHLNEALGVLGYPVPGDTPTGRYKCGLCEARDKQLEQVTAERDEAVNICKGIIAPPYLTNNISLKQQLAAMTAERDELRALRVSLKAACESAAAMIEARDKQLAEAREMIARLTRTEWTQRLLKEHFEED